MLIDQAKYAENVTKNLSSEDNGKGLENLLMQSQPKPDEGFFAGKIEKFSQDKKAKPAESGAVDMSTATYQKPGFDSNRDKDEKSLFDNLGSQLEVDAQTRKNQMVVMSNTVSPEDYKEMAKDGFSLEDSIGATVITETDKIQAVLAQAGADTSSFGSSLNSEQLEQITGNAALANQIMREMQKADLPVTTYNMDDSMEAFAQAASIGQLSDNAIAYMLENELSPTIGNLYTASHSSQIQGAYYKSASLSEEDFAGMQKQVEEIISEAGLEVNSESLEECGWLIKGGIGLNADNLKYYEALKNFAMNLSNSEDSSKAISAMITALKEGARPADAILVDGYSMMDKAQAAMDVINQTTEADIQYVVEQEQNFNIENLRKAHGLTSRADYVSSISISIDIKMVTARRQLEEVRLSMTLQANYSLLKRGISIDTTDLQQLVEELKNQETQYYKDLLDGNGVEASAENIKRFSDTTELLKGLQSKPAYAMTLSTSFQSLTVLNNRADSVQADFVKVSARYETMMTGPRPDMGDDIQKAFRNVDDILADLNMETTEENQRAVRILAYNETEITEENISKMKAVDEDVQRAFKNMTPAVTLEMIRQGKNPLDMSIAELNETATAIRQQTGNEDADRFSKYLWKLEQNKAISEEERSSYIGIYRLIAQVEKTDGAVIGSLINQGAEITMRNMLSAVRTDKRGKLDYTIDEDFAGVNSTVENKKIDDQIMANYNLNLVRDVMDMITPEAVEPLVGTDWENLTPEELKNKLDTNTADASEEIETQYAMEQLEAFEEATSASDTVYQMLEKYNIPNSVANIVAASRMIENPSRMIKEFFREATDDPNEDLFDFSFFGKEGANADNIRKIKEMKRYILDKFGEAVKTPEELADAQETLAETATHAMDNMIMEDPDTRNLDIKSMKLICKQFNIAKDMAKSESYVIPVETGDGVVTGVSLKIIRGKEKKGTVDIFFNAENMGKVAASFEAKDNSIVSGVIATDDEDTKRLMSENLQLLAEKINENAEEFESLDLRVAYIKDLSSEQFAKTSMEKDEKATKEGKEVSYIQTKRLYQLAESFIQTVSELTM